MPNLQFSMTSWGAPAAPKRALVLHGLMGTGAVFFKVAETLVAEGYRVDAPDLLGHGWAPHTPPYTPESVAQYLADNLKDQPGGYDVIAGVSIGSTIAAVLYTLLPAGAKPKRLVLAEPIFDHPGIPAERVEEMLETTRNLPTEESILKANPTWIRPEAVLRRMSLAQIDPEAIVQLAKFRENFKHSLLPSAKDSSSTEIIILAADPDKRSVYPASNASLLEEKYPHVKFIQRLGATHDMHKDKPDVLAGVMMNGLGGCEKLECTIIRGSERGAA